MGLAGRPCRWKQGSPAGWKDKAGDSVEPQAWWMWRGGVPYAMYVCLNFPKLANMPSISFPACIQGAALQDLADSMTSQVKDAKEGMGKMLDPEIERKREEAAKMAWGGAAAAAAGPATVQPAEAGSSSGGGSSGQPAVAAAAPAAAPMHLDSLSVEQLEAELQRRKAAAAKAVPKELRADD